MSMRSWTENGFGMPLFSGYNDGMVYGFLKEHSPELVPTEEELQEALDSGDDICYILWDYIGEPVSWHIANIINKLEGTTVFKGYAPCGDTNQEEMIGIEPAYSWTMNDVDRSLTKGRAMELLNKYGRLLGIQEIPEYFRAEYCG